MGFRTNLRFMARAIFARKQPKVCPYCGEQKLVEIDKKYFVYFLLQCSGCHLRHRHPKDDELWLRKFYQKEYSIHNRMMTDLPSDDEIKELKQNYFPDLRDFHPYIKTLFEKPIQLIDYGCSWGYNVYKLIRNGHVATGYEVSVPRTEFGKLKLGIPIVSNLTELPYNNDLVLSSHVIEHLNDIKEFVAFSKNHLSKHGVFMAFCPNGSDEYRQREPLIWHGSWGTYHVNCLDIAFAKNLFKNNPYLLLTGDWEFNTSEIAAWDGLSQKIGNKLDGKELLIIAKPNIKIKN